MAEQDAFFAEPRVVTIRGEAIAVPPFASKKLARAARLAAPLVESFANGFEFSPASALKLLEHTDDVIRLCALATDKDEEFVGNLDPAELMAVATAVVEENADFFIRHLVPLATSAMGQFAKVAAGAGQALSPLSDAPASPEQK